MRQHLPRLGAWWRVGIVTSLFLLAGCSAAAASRGTSTSSARVVTATSPAARSAPVKALPHVNPRVTVVGTTTHPPTTTRSSSTTTTTRAAPPTTGSAPAPAASCAAPPLQPAAAGLVVGRVTAVGDSVMIDLEPYLSADVKGIAFDAVVGQQWSTGIGDVESLRQSGQLGSVVVIELGTNGPITTGLFDGMMQALHGASRVVFVTNYVPDFWQDPNNAIIESGAARFPNTAVANWYALAAANPGWLCPDGFHLSCGGPGAQEMAALIARCV